MPHSPKAIVGGRRDLDDIPSWINGAFGFWANRRAQSTGPGSRLLQVVDKVFARPVDAMPLLAQRLHEEEQTRLRLTDLQVKAMAILGTRRRVAIAGGAGTGKTVLAVAKARRMADEGFRTLLVCYNRPLADHLARVCAGVARLQVMNFHQLCNRWIDAAKSFGRNFLTAAADAYPGRDTYDVHMPLALAYAVERIPERFDAIVVDEGQDFREEYWLPLEMLLSDPDKSPLCIFFDQNQNLYMRVSTFPIKDEPFVLTANCRNTKVIHDAAYRFFRGELTDPPDIPGARIECIHAPTLQAQADRIGALITRLIAVERVKPCDIAVLMLDAQDRAARYEALAHRPLPRPAAWGVETYGTQQTVLLDTVNRFKGLEAAVVILWAIDTLPLQQNQELLYVGLSRAKSILFLCGSENACQQLLG
jgi:superfamily I DNA and RNA helicase